MTLKEYLTWKSLTDTAFAREIGVVPSTVLRLKSGDRSPSMALARKIMEATGGKVRPDDFLHQQGAA
jgi:DNA-binding XRE family transcriptional regulator